MICLRVNLVYEWMSERVNEWTSERVNEWTKIWAVFFYFCDKIFEKYK